MHIFFKLLSLVGSGSSLGGVIYFAQQDYTNIHEGVIKKKQTSENIKKKGVNIREQPSSELSSASVSS